MSYKIFSFLIALCCPLLAMSQTLTIKVSNLKTKTSPIRIGLYKSTSGFPKEDKTYKALEVMPDKEGSVTISFSNLPTGDYAIAVYQDKNKNQKLDKNVFGYPNEPFGFSKNVKPRFSAPSFNDCKISYTKENHTFTINLLD